MNLWQCIRVALRALNVNSLRSALTVLGIVIGVAAVITMIAIGAGGQAKVSERLRTLGTNLLIVVPGAQTEGRASLGAGTRHTLTERDADAIAQEIPFVTVSAPAVVGPVRAVRGNRNWSTNTVGATASHLIAREWQPMAGRNFTGAEVEAAAKVAVLGATVFRRLFGADDPIEHVIRIGNVPVTVIGVLEAKGQSASGRDQDDFILMPITAVKSRILGGKHAANRQAVDYIYVKVANAEILDPTAKRVVALLRERHRLQPDAPDDFTVRNLTSIYEARQDATRTLGVLLIAVASVSLAVGGISIMNILLVSITERTREIGLRMAVGARPSHIRNQFLIEAVTLSVFGGLGGSVLGTAASVVIAETAEWPVLITPGIFLLAVGFAAAVGIFFGIYPAVKASRLTPIDALRFE